MANVEIIKGNRLQSKRNTGATLNKVRIAPYVRVSTDDEDQINSYNSQKKYYTEITQTKPEWVLVDIYADKAVTGTKTDKRENFQRLIADCMNGKIDMVIAKSISRFARNTLDTLKYVRMLKDRNIAVQFEEENINTLTMDGELLLTILSSVAQQEVENTSAHVKKGLKMKMQRGELVGYQGCLGYDYDKETKSISINEEEAEIVRYIFARYLSGVGTSVIAKELTKLGYTTQRGLNKWCDSTILGIITNEKYKGDILQGKTFTVDPISKRRIANMGEEDKFYCSEHHAAIISPEDFADAQNILSKRSHSRLKGEKRERYSRMYTFSSMLTCGFCGGVLSRRSWNSGTKFQKTVWECSVATKHGKENCQHSKGIPEEVIESAFVEAYNILADNGTCNTDAFIKRMGETLDIDNQRKKLNDLKKDVRDKENRRNKLVDLHLNSVLDKETFEQKYQQICEEETAARNRVAELTNIIENNVSTMARLEQFRKTIGERKSIKTFETDVFHEVIDRVIVGRYNDDETPDPYHLTFVFKNGEKHNLHVEGLGRQGKNTNIPKQDTSHVECVVLMSRVKA